MYKLIASEVVAIGKGQEDRLYREKTQKLFDKYGVPRQIWRLEGRKAGQIVIEYGPFESQEAAETALAKVRADEEWQALTKARGEAGTVVGGTIETYMLTDYWR